MTEAEDLGFKPPSRLEQATYAASKRKIATIKREDALIIPRRANPAHLSGANQSGVSADGSIVVGTGSSSGALQAYRWAESTGMVSLGACRVTLAFAFGVSADGSAVVGDAETGTSNQAYRWTTQSGMVGLGFLLGTNRSYAYGVNSDGSVIVGESDNNTGTREAYRWTPFSGMQSIEALLYAGGVDFSGWTLQIAWSVSAEGCWHRD